MILQDFLIYVMDEQTISIFDTKSGETNTKKLYEIDEIRAKAILNLPMTKQEKAKFLLFYSTMEEATEFLRKEKGGAR